MSTQDEIIDLVNRLDMALADFEVLAKRRSEMIRRYRDTSQKADPAEFHANTRAMMSKGTLIAGLRDGLAALHGRRPNADDPPYGAARRAKSLAAILYAQQLSGEQPKDGAQ
jgi:hypothetical protein